MNRQAAAAAAPSTTDNTTKSQPVKTRNEKQEKLSRLLQESLSRKIKLFSAAEKVVGKEEEEGGEGGEGAGSVSPTSTVSSSGERAGRYFMYDDGRESGDLSGDCHMIMSPQLYTVIFVQYIHVHLYVL